MAVEEPEDSDFSGLDDAIARASMRLSGIQSKRPFSDKGFDALEGNVAEYIRSLVLESAKTADRQGADVVSASDVQQAARYLFRNTTRSILAHVGTVGGVLLGAGLSNGLALLAEDKPSTGGILATLGFAVVGAFMIAFHVARDTR